MCSAALALLTQLMAQAVCEVRRSPCERRPFLHQAGMICCMWPAVDWYRQLTGGRAGERMSLFAATCLACTQLHAQRSDAEVVARCRVVRRQSGFLYPAHWIVRQSGGHVGIHSQECTHPYVRSAVLSRACTSRVSTSVFACLWHPAGPPRMPRRPRAGVCVVFMFAALAMLLRCRAWAGEAGCMWWQAGRV